MLIWHSHGLLEHRHADGFEHVRFVKLLVVQDFDDLQLASSEAMLRIQLHASGSSLILRL